MSDLIETVFVEINVRNRKNIIIYIGTIYRPPASDGRGFHEEMQNVLANPVFFGILIVFSLEIII